MTYYYDEETGTELCQHSEETIKRNGFNIEVFIEETAYFRPFGAFIKGYGTKYGKDFEEAIDEVLKLTKK